MRILLTTSEFPPAPGGIATHAYELARGLTARGCRVTVVSPQDYASPDDICAFNASAPFRIVRLRHLSPSPLEGLYRLAVLRKEISRLRANALITSGDRAAWLAPLLRRGSQPAHLAVGHGTEFGARRAWEQYLTRRAFQGATAVVSVSEYTQSRMHALGIWPGRDLVISNGADEQVFHPMDNALVRQMRKRTGDDTPDVILTVGRLCARKGQDIVVRAMAAVLKRRPHAHYLMVGLQDNRADLERLALEIGVGGHVHFLGPVAAETLVAAYNACDVFVMTSRHAGDGSFEGYGIAVVEAALCGKAAIVARGSGLQEAIAPGRTGMLVAEDSPEETAAAIIGLLEDPRQRARMGDAARERALAEQTWSVRISAYAEILRTLSNLGPAPRA